MSFMEVFKWFLHSRDHVPRFYFSYAFQRLSSFTRYKKEDEEEKIEKKKKKKRIKKKRR